MPYDDEIITRSAPRWAWATIDETLAMDAESKAFAAELRDEIKLATAAVVIASEDCHLSAISKVAVQLWEGE